MYRPTVRYSNTYKEYVDQVFHSTTLDRNQIIRLALFAAPFSPLFQNQLQKYMTSPLPPTFWEVVDHGLWIDQSFEIKEERGKDVRGNSDETFSKQPDQPEQIERSAKEFCKQRVFKQQGGITIKIG